ncbi:MAG: AbrB/MazE/SpoVT family DNA-binding domain-containing protein [Gammaproteobacteria bacterium]|nr:AbrB/MazE/SpoVT family DNA-binding domain-containing protein [Gammaproteobacteria bacterium]
MLAKLTTKNQLTLPKAIVSHFPGVLYFDVSAESGRIVLAPVRVNQGDSVRAKLAELGIDESDVRDAVNWARESR